MTLTPSQQLATAIALASSEFLGKFDRGGKPYILHCLEVARMLRSDDMELIAAAVLHDLFEDTNVTAAELRSRGFTERVITAVLCVTKMPGESEEEYKAKVRSNKDAIRIKMSDLQHNSDIRRLKGVTEKDVKRIEKYMKFYDELKQLWKEINEKC
jgi:(p)ppGpp synthase/HD superfamily hydrolase